MAKCREVRRLQAGQARREIGLLVEAVDELLRVFDPEEEPDPVIRRAVEGLARQRSTLS